MPTLPAADAVPVRARRLTAPDSATMPPPPDEMARAVERSLSAAPARALPEDPAAARLRAAALQARAEIAASGARALVLDADDLAEAVLTRKGEALEKRLSGAAAARFGRETVGEQLPVWHASDLLGPAVTIHGGAIDEMPGAPDYDPDRAWRLIRLQSARLPVPLTLAHGPAGVEGTALVDLGLAPETYAAIVDFHEMAHAVEPLMRGDDGFGGDPAARWRSEALADATSLLVHALEGGDAARGFEAIRAKRTLLLAMSGDDQHWTVPALDALRPVLLDPRAHGLTPRPFADVVAWADAALEKTEPLRLHAKWSTKLMAWAEELPLGGGAALEILDIARDYVAARRAFSVSPRADDILAVCRTLARRQARPELTLAVSALGALNAAAGRSAAGSPVMRPLAAAGVALAAEAADRLEGAGLRGSRRAAALAALGTDSAIEETARRIAADLPPALAGLKPSLEAAAARLEDGRQLAAAASRRGIELEAR